MFEGIGNINTYAKMQALKQRAEKNINSSFAYTKEDNQQQNLGQFKISVSKPTIPSKNTFKLKLIKGKLSRGKKLSQGELEYLRQNARQLYAKALKITLDREELERRLKTCKTKEEAMEVRRSFVSSAATPSVAPGDASGGSAGGEIASAGADTGVPSSGGDCAAVSALAASGEAAVVSLSDNMSSTPSPPTSYSATGSVIATGTTPNVLTAQDGDIELPESILRQRAFEDAWLEYSKRKKYHDLAATEQEYNKRKKHHKISIEI